VVRRFAVADDRRMRVVATGSVRALLVAIGLIVLSACGSDDDDAASSDVAAALEGRTFVSTEVTGQTLVPGTSLTISFEDGRLAAVAGCNTMTGGYELDGDTLVVDPLAQTLMACEGNLSDQDAWVAALLSGSPSVALAGESLTLTSDDVTVVLQDQAADAEPPLSGSVWAIESVTTATGSSDAPEGASITYEDGSVHVSTGCNQGNTEVTEADGVLTFGPMAMTRMACEPAVMEVETRIVEVLGLPLTFEADGDVLTLSNGDSSMVLRRVP
jgi:heat shock protein HslJ